MGISRFLQQGQLNFLFVLSIDSSILWLSVPSQQTTHQLSLQCQECE